MGLFKKKEGGTFLGNLVRGIGDKFTGGMVSTLMPKPTAGDFNSAGEYTGAATGLFGGALAKGKPDAPATLPTVSGIDAAKSLVKTSAPAGGGAGSTPPAPTPTGSGFMDWLTKNWIVAAAVAVGGTVLAIFISKRKGKKSSNRR